MEKPEPFVFVIFGATGDLTARKLAPALFALHQQRLLPSDFSLLGIGRKPLNDYAFREKLHDALDKFSRLKTAASSLEQFLSHIHYQSLDYSHADDYQLLKQRLVTLDEQYGSQGRYLFYLATPPELFTTIAALLAKQGLHQTIGETAWRRIIVEKPFGFNGQTAAVLNAQLGRYFDESQIYRIDHYLGKETVQNILAFRFANGIFEPLWNRNYIHHIEVLAAEQIGIENRGGYYDRAGALRDMVQSHLLEVVSIVAMEPPVTFVADAIRNEKVKVLQALAPITADRVAKQVVRGQYLAAEIRGEKVAGYRQEPLADPNSRTETFVALKFFIDNWRWAGVPIYLRTGKRLPTRVTEVVMHFRPTPHHLFKEISAGHSCENLLVLRLQPDEGILLQFGLKVPGAGYTIKNVSMDFHYRDLGDGDIPEAYERLLLDALNGDNTLFARADAVEASWNFIDPILQAWEQEESIPLYGYPAGTWGPREADELFADSNETWRFPCRNFSDDQSYCEL